MFDKSSVRAAGAAVRRLPAAAEKHTMAAMEHNAREAHAYMQALVPRDTGATASKTVAFAYNDSDGIGMQMQTSRPDSGEDYTGQTIRMVLFVNNADFLYGTWRLNKKRWKARVKRGYTKAAKEFHGV